MLTGRRPLHAPKSRQTSLDGLLGSWTSATAGWFKKVSAEYMYVMEGAEGGGGGGGGQ